MDSITYYIVQVNDCYYQGQIDLQTFTDDEEQAFTFIDIAIAYQLSIKINGTVLTREISYVELEQNSIQHKLEYEALPSKERDRIESFCSKLNAGI
ncbi:hypothetical protein AEA09_02270 [Lysinibacillus contaminans]|uniref:Pullulanase n=1 Tax=Lysinibacillus contaminans TaxID=1293441 RepID=A0ABR5K6E8_9BACI|nr:hypothetical protein [Lysinibacillus contaminans]KOS70339.1 hypothetical protein AEA09_02270 [Lysinibacillus contaminans]